MSSYATAPKKTTSVSLAEPLLAEAKSLGINVSQAAEEGLAKAVSLKREERWIQENWDAIQSSNEYVERHGLPLAKFRMF
jgi:antitoxin CcdA